MARASRVASRSDEGIAVAVAADPGAEADELGQVADICN